MASKSLFFAAKTQKYQAPSTVTKYSVTRLSCISLFCMGPKLDNFCGKNLLLIHSSQQNLGCVSGSQGRREPNVGPGSAQILGISGFICYKTEKKYGTIMYLRILISKKKVFKAKWHNFLRILRRSPKKKIFDFSQTDLSVSFRWAL